MRRLKHAMMLSLAGIALLACNLAATFAAREASPASVETHLPVPTVPEATAVFLEQNSPVQQPGQSPAAPVSIAPPTSSAPVFVDIEDQLYDVLHRIRLINNGQGTASLLTVRVALIQSAEPYQTLVSRDITPPDYRLVYDENDNVFAEFNIRNLKADELTVIELQYQVLAHVVRTEPGNCEGELPQQFTGPETNIESNAPEMIATAESLTTGAETACDRARALYLYVADNMTYSGYETGDESALATLKHLDGDCTQYAALLVGLLRAAYIPARFMEGVVCCTDHGYAEARHKHDWVEAYLPGAGWVTLDPTYGREAALQDSYFANLYADRILVTRGRHLEALSGYHYYAYSYTWNQKPASISAEETWSVEKTKE